MKNKRKFIRNFLAEFSYLKKTDTIIWYFTKDRCKCMYSEDISLPYNSDKNKFYDHSMKQLFTTKQFVKHIIRLNKIKVFW